MQKRLVRKLDLEMLLSRIKPHPTPKPELEQYTISVDVAASMLYLATYANNDIAGKSVLDLGCGTGRLALGAAFLGAEQVVGIDIDKAAVKMAVENSVRTGLRHKVQWIVGDIDAIRGEFDTILQNPPFGVQKPMADRKFLEKALETGKVIYSLHKNPGANKALAKEIKVSKTKFAPASPSPFLQRFVENRGGKIRTTYTMVMSIPHMFSFHTEKKHQFIADLYIIERQ
jgi:putative methylase